MQLPIYPPGHPATHSSSHPLIRPLFHQATQPSSHPATHSAPVIQLIAHPSSHLISNDVLEVFPVEAFLALVVFEHRRLQLRKVDATPATPPGDDAGSECSAVRCNPPRADDKKEGAMVSRVARALCYAIFPLAKRGCAAAISQRL